LIVFFAMLVLAVRSLSPPEPLPLDAPADQFSGLRAAETLKFLLADEKPHPVGSIENRAVHDRLIETLKELGLTPHTQHTVGCSQKASICANVANVVAEIPGASADAVMMMAHYDSVPHAPGAADDGSGVVTLLESARVLISQPARRNRILLVFTDAEEMGLLGAEGFFASHPWVADVKAVINIEGAGSSGPSLLLRSSNPAGHLLDAYRRSAENPTAISYSQEVFARMPNDTDFTVSDRAGIPSIDFAFAFEFNHYHTPLDTIENLDKGTLQHHGDNVLPLVQTLAAMDLTSSEANFSYLTVEQSIWLTWPVGWTVAITIFGLLMLAAINLRLRALIPIQTQLGGVLLAVAALSAALLSCFAALWLAGWLVGTTVNYPAIPWPWRLLMFAGALLPVCLLGRWARDRLSFWARYLGVWWLLGSLALVLAILAPLAANLLIIPLLAAGLAGLIATVAFNHNSARVQSITALVATGVFAYLLLGVSYAMEQTQGLNLAPAIYGGVALIMLTFLPYRDSARLNAALAASLVLAWVWAPLTALYSEWRPQHISFYYVLDRDQQNAHWSMISANPLPARVIDVLGRAPAAAHIVPWATRQSYPSIEAGLIETPAPNIEVERIGSSVSISIQSRGSGDYLQLILPAEAGISNLRVAGHPVTMRELSGFVQARFFAAGNKPVLFEFDTEASTPFEGFVVDGSHTLPAIGVPLSDARGTLAVPQHQGDQRIVFQRIQF
jgi:hypothetical protein